MCVCLEGRGRGEGVEMTMMDWWWNYFAILIYSNEFSVWIGWSVAQTNHIWNYLPKTQDASKKILIDYLRYFTTFDWIALWKHSNRFALFIQMSTSNGTNDAIYNNWWLDFNKLKRPQFSLSQNSIFARAKFSKRRLHLKHPKLATISKCKKITYETMQTD